MNGLQICDDDEPRQINLEATPYAGMISLAFYDSKQCVTLSAMEASELRNWLENWLLSLEAAADQCDVIEAGTQCRLGPHDANTLHEFIDPR